MTEQWQAALNEANRVRARRAWLKRMVKTGRMTLAEAIDAPEFATMRASEFLAVLPWRSRTGLPDPRCVVRRPGVLAQRMARECGVLPTRRVGMLTARERGELVAWWDARESRRAAA